MSRFHGESVEELVEILVEELGISAEEVDEYKSYDEVFLAEMVATELNLIDSEEALSELFDQSIRPMVIDQYGEDDTPAMDQAFNDWSDGLVSDGQLHPSQYHEYGYCGINV